MYLRKLRLERAASLDCSLHGRLAARQRSLMSMLENVIKASPNHNTPASCPPTTKLGSPPLRASSCRPCNHSLQRPTPAASATRQPRTQSWTPSCPHSVEDAACTHAATVVCGVVRRGREATPLSQARHVAHACACFFAAVARFPAAPTRWLFWLAVFLTPLTEAPAYFLESLVLSRCWSRQPAPACQCAPPSRTNVLPQ